MVEVKEVDKTGEFFKQIDTNKDRLRPRHEVMKLLISVHRLDKVSTKPLAIDHRNTINLQKAIDQYYDGDLALEQALNLYKDYHQYQIAKQMQQKRRKI